MPKSSHEKNPKRKASISPEDQKREARQLPGLTISSPPGNSSSTTVGRKVRPSGPKIVIEEDSAASSLSQLDESITTLAQEHVESDDGDDQSLSSAEGFGDGFLLPPCFRYTLCVTCLGQSTLFKEHDLYWNDPDSYRNFEQSASELAEEASGRLDETSIMTFRHGYCTISKGKDGAKRRLGLTSRDEWKRLCKTLVEDFNSGVGKPYKLVIYYEYFELRTRPDKAEIMSFPVTKRWELKMLMKTNIDERKFISNADLQKYTSEQMIRAIVMNDPCWGPSPKLDDIEQLIQDILEKKAKNLLAMCVYARVDMKCLKYLINVGHHHDGNLPQSSKECCPAHQRYSMDILDEPENFQAAMFKTPGEHQKLPSQVIVPIIPIDSDIDVRAAAKSSTDSDGDSDSPSLKSQSAKDRAMIGFGAHGRVYRVKIDPYHHKLSEDRDAEFALKEFKATGSSIDSSRESEMLQALRRYSHPHLTTHLVTWTHGGNYYMLFPLAKCNLHDYMKHDGFQHTVRNQVWLLEQFGGLASALQRIHDLTFVNSDSNLSPSPVQQENEQKAGWHHDLKPENILLFEYLNLNHKVLQIADFGSSKIRIVRSRSHPTKTPRGTLTYEPPEMETKGETSRPYDVWSLGCVFLEVLIWAMMGFASLENFKQRRTSRRTSEGFFDDGFWEKRPDGTVALRDAVRQWIEELEKKVDRQPRQPFKKLLDFITTDMLEFDPKKRAVAENVNLNMDRILAQQKAVLQQGDSKGLEISPIALLPQSSLSSPSRRSSTIRSWPEPSSSPFKNTTITDVGWQTASPIDHISPHSVHPSHTRNSSASEPMAAPPIRSRATSNASTSSHSPLNPSAPRHDVLSPTTLRPPSSPRASSSSRPPSSHSAPSTVDEGK